MADFDKALEKDDERRRLHELVREERLFEKLNEGGTYAPSNRGPHAWENRDRTKGRKLSWAVRRANSSLKAAANHLCLAAAKGETIVFLGDAEAHEIRQIVHELTSKSLRRFHILVTPHHGTHWHHSLGTIRSEFSVTSNGPKLCSKMIPHFKALSRKSYATFANGDIWIASSPNADFP